MKSIYILILFISLLVPYSAKAQINVLVNAHSHNDYKQLHPLSDALSHGFISIEADIFLKRNRLIVSHLQPILKSKTLETIYLKPLQDIVAQNSGSVYVNNKQPLILLIDIK